MEQPTQNTALLDLMIQPGFTVRDHRIQRVNAAAARLLITPGEDVRDMLATGQEEYAAFTQGCLYLTVKLGSQVRGLPLWLWTESRCSCWIRSRTAATCVPTPWPGSLCAIP